MTDVSDETGDALPSSDPAVGEAVKWLIASLGRDKSVQVTGRSWKQLTRYVNDAAEPPFSVVRALAQAAGRSIDQLLLDPAVATGSFLAKHVGFDLGDDPQGFTLVPRYDVSASAGHGLVALAEEVMDRLAFKTGWLREMGLSPAFVGLLTCSGDSQDPVIKDGALMLVDLRPDQQIRSGNFYIVVLDGDVLVKLVNRRVDGTIELISHNPAYPKEIIDSQQLDKLTIPGRVVWAGQRL
tara:strand:- start:493 stop:1209 length:717 start_codon:yes stop_codon:yes gene_type:complete